MRELASNKKMITGRHLMTQNINDTMVKQIYETTDARHCRTKSAQASVIPQQGSPKGCFYLVKKKWGFEHDEVPETFCQRLNDVAESCVSLSVASKKQTYCNRQCVDGIDAIGMTKLSSRG